VMWVVSPTAMIIAQKFIPIDLWVPFFNLVQFVIGVCVMYANRRVQAVYISHTDIVQC
jgi:hypothetical protein